MAGSRKLSEKPTARIARARELEESSAREKDDLNQLHGNSFANV
ncbi:MAG: hypothetical protein NT120_00470 [Candidatus Aenigmarchaeota archaeon]|nr:hypothetical protein [Candidatus Aenigmarchaeota archaeon]